MRVFNAGTMETGFWVGKWHGHMATHKPQLRALNFSSRHPIHHLILCRSRGYHCFKMETIPPPLGYVFRPLSRMPPLSQPLRSYCPAGVVERSSRTQTGRRCSVLCCIEILPGHHYSQSILCHLNFSPANCFTSTIVHSALWCHHPASSSV